MTPLAAAILRHLLALDWVGKTELSPQECRWLAEELAARLSKP